MARKSLPKETRDEIITMAQTDPPLTVKEIAAETGLSAPSVYRILQEEGVTAAKAYSESSFRRLTPEERKVFVERYLDYESILVLLDEYSLNHTQMYQLLREEGIEPRMRQKQHQEAHDAAMEHALDLYMNTNLTITEITEETGIHQPSLHSQIHARKIPLRRPKRVAKGKKGDETAQAESEAAV